MTKPRCAAALLVLVGGCAQIQTTSVVEIVPKEGAAAVVIGPPAAAITARGATATWTQTGRTIEFEVFATRQCAVLRHDPVVRIERITRKSGGAVYWEFGIGGALLAGGLTALIRPELFSQPAINAAGETVRDTAAGYRLGGILTALSAVAIGAGIYDVVRTRDELRTTDAYRAHVGEAHVCDEPERPLAGRSFELVVGDWTAEATADDAGRAKLQLPGADSLPPAQSPAIADDLGASASEALAGGGFFDNARLEGMTAASQDRVEIATNAEGDDIVVPASHVRSGVLRLGGREAMAFDFVVPYESPSAQGHRGEVVIEPQPLRRAPAAPRPSAKSDSQ